MRKVTFLFLCPVLFLIFSNVLTASNKTNKTVHAYRLNQEVQLDGKLTEDVWLNPAVDDFTQKDPKEGEKSSERTKVWVAYDDNFLYCAAKLYDSHPDSIITRLARRDNFDDSDWFALAVDSYNDKKTAFYFLVNPSGSIEDGVFFNDSWSDNSWDGVWDYAVSRDTDSWCVEMKIPFSQLRFNQADEMVWGVNFIRTIVRKNEEAHFVMVPKKESGFVSHFADLVGLSHIKTKQRFEILPYLVQKAQYLVHDKNDPYYKSNQYRTAVGADLKVGIGSNLTLDATFNPDFGQVEVDPAVVNLSAFETFYDEKRPFFIEGSNIFNFGYGGANSNWGFNWGNPDFLYSRRIGRAPQGDAGDYDYADYPSETRILGAAKVTGKIGENWSLGAIEAVTERTFAQTSYNGARGEAEVEPLTNYAILRSQKEFNSSKQALGMIFTAVNRDLKSDNLKANLSRQAYTFGLDGWTFLDSSETYVVNGFVGGSYVAGSKEYLIKLQNNSLHYYQRPDATYAKLDSNRTSLSGFISRIALNKQKGNFYINSAFGIVTPGFEANDAGFQWRANTINAHMVVGYKWFDPDDIFRRKNINIAHARNYDFEGNKDNDIWGIFSNAQFLNYYGFELNLFYAPEKYSNRLTRGGPIAKIPNGYEFNFYGYSDSRKEFVLDVNAYASGDGFGSLYYSYGFGLQWKPSTAIDVSIKPSFDMNSERIQWVDRVDDPLAAETYGARYIFAELNQKTISANIRVNWTFTPKLSLQLYMQPLFSVGDYNSFKEFSRPKSLDFLVYGKNGSTINYDSESDSYNIDPDGNGQASQFSLDNPDFNYKSIIANLVLRWEFLPGSAFYFVWQHNKQNFEDPGEFSLKKDFKNLLRTEPNNVYLVKFTYWLDI
ncbi:MAG: hypothetical protein C4539_06375 [Ignavibacteriales bacterium]|nr:MAG: hypothetical protein C4539_06375 [Ignavibacteriales bacterium]